MNCDMVGLLTLDDVLRLLSRSMVYITFEAKIRHDLLQNDPTNSTGLGVPSDVVAALERLGHRTRSIVSERHMRIQDGNHHDENPISLECRIMTDVIRSDTKGPLHRLQAVLYTSILEVGIFRRALVA